MTPEPCAKVTFQAHSCAQSICVPVGNATLAFGGTVTVVAQALPKVTSFHQSVNTNVYVVQVCVFIVLMMFLLVRSFVLDTVGITTPSTASTQALLLDKVVSEACHISKLQAGFTENTEVPLCSTSIVLDVHRLSTIRAIQEAPLVACLILTTQFEAEAVAVPSLQK